MRGLRKLCVVNLPHAMLATWVHVLAILPGDEDQSNLH